MKSNKIVIGDIDSLCQLILDKNISFKVIEKAVTETLGCYIFPVEDRSQLVYDLKEFWLKYGNKRIENRPLFPQIKYDDDGNRTDKLKAEIIL